MKHDMNYTLAYFYNNNYLCESTVSDLFKKIIEFIKSVINKMREIIKKLIGILFGTNSGRKRVEELERQIAEEVAAQNKRNKEEASKRASNLKFKMDVEFKTERRASDHNPSDYYDDQMFKGQNLENLSTAEKLKGSKRTIGIVKYVHFDKKKEVTNNFMDAVYATVGNYLSDYDNVNELFLKSIERTCFKGPAKNQKKLGVVDRLKIELGEPSETVQLKIAELDYKIIESYYDEKQIAKFLENADVEVNRSLEDLKSKMKKLEQTEGNNVTSEDFNNIEKVVVMVSTFMTYITQNVVRAHKVSVNILIQALMDFANCYC
jgi:hypothetical protein